MLGQMCVLEALVLVVLVTLFATSWTVADQAPLSIGFSRQEYLSGLPCPPPGNLPDPGIKPVSLALVGGFFTTEAPAKPSGGIGGVEIIWSDCKK